MTMMGRSVCLFVILIAVTPAWGQSAFPQGVASGDALSDRAICWTRTTAPGTVRVEIATDDSFTQIVSSALLSANSENGLTVKFDATPLTPATRYLYRFTRTDNGVTSTNGSFVTAPSSDEDRAFRFVYSGDSNAGRQPFRLLDFAANEAPDFWVYAGDTIYGDQSAGELGIATNLSDYRAKYAQNRSDAALKRLSAAAAVWMQWDDHEVTNDYDGGDPEVEVTPAQIVDAYQAFFENQPIRDQAIVGDSRRTYRSFRHGALAEFFLLDCRQYRSRDAGRDGGGLDPYGYVLGPPEPDTIARIEDPSRTMLGTAQFAWLKAGLAASTARWKFVLSSVTFTSLLIQPYDRWDGYDAERYDLLKYIDDQKIEGVVILSADIHGNTYNPDVTYYLRNSLGQTFSQGFRVPEFVTGPIGQATIRQELGEVAADYLNLPPWLADCSLIPNILIDFAQGQVRDRNGLAFLEPDRYGYLVVDVTPEGVSFTHRGIPGDSLDTSTPISTMHTTFLPEPSLCGSLSPVLPAALAWAIGPAKVIRRSRRNHVKR